MGQELVHRTGRAPSGLWSAALMRENPELVKQIHSDFFAAGAEIATANTYTLHRDRLRPAGLEHEFEQLHRLACTLACEARDAHGQGIVAGALGPLGWSYSHDGAPPPAQWAELYNEICALQLPYVDLFLIETIGSISHALSALHGASGHGKPVWLALTVDDADGTKLRSGESLEKVLGALQVQPPDCLLLNCSSPEAVTQGLTVLNGCAVPTGGYANGFTGIEHSFLRKGSSVSALSAREDLTPALYADQAEHWIASGAKVVGGCCEIGPAHIAELSRRFGTMASSSNPHDA
ncbi:homocysteine S-methyltransferase family protein [Roseibium hamelinense]|nr:homocysteine S-methyltransferase family protein [Roseibium hamelinense]